MAHFKKTDRPMRNCILILLGFIFLILWLILGYPLEISDLTTDRNLMTFFAVIIGVTVFLIYKLSRRLQNIILKITLYISLIGVSLIYAWIGLWTLLISHDNGPIWEDRQVYTNQKGTKVISQFRETSGSIYDYRERLIFYEFSNSNRISIEWAKKRMHGTWNVIDYKKDSTYTENFDKKVKKKNAP